MVREAWVKPMTLVQKFEANEAVTACLQVACKSGTYGEYQWYGGIEVKGKTYHPAELDGQNPWGRGEALGTTAFTMTSHDERGCHDASNSGVVIDSNGVISFTGNARLCSHKDSDGDGLADVGERIYWYEDYKDLSIDINFNHWGTIEPSSNKS